MSGYDLGRSSYDASSGGISAAARSYRAKIKSASVRHLRATAGQSSRHSLNDGHWVDRFYESARRLEAEAETLSRQRTNV